MTCTSDAMAEAIRGCHQDDGTVDENAMSALLQQPCWTKDDGTFAKNALKEAMQLLLDDTDHYSITETDDGKALNELSQWATRRHATLSPKRDAEKNVWWAHQRVASGGEGAYFGDVVHDSNPAVCEGFGMMLYLPTQVENTGVSSLAGGRYKGMWARNKRNGAGTMRYEDGTTEVGGWKDDAFVSDGPLVGTSYRLRVRDPVYNERSCKCLSYVPSSDRWCVQLLDGDMVGIRVRHTAMLPL
jgi:hypothetical protein